MGQIFEFGRYPQTRDGGILPIKWKVLEIKNKKAFLLSECGLDKKPYDGNICSSSPYTTRTKVTWCNSDIRRWLNSTFLSNAFSDTEKKKICKTNNNNYIYSVTQNTYWTPGITYSYDISKNASSSTEDYIFLPTLNDTEKMYSFRYDGKSKENIEEVMGSPFCRRELYCDIMYSEWLLRDLVYYK